MSIYVILEILKSMWRGYMKLTKQSKMNKLIDLSLDNAIDRDTFLERKERMQNQKMRAK